jgi:predicted CoA-substrate-specific enzyme activase
MVLSSRYALKTLRAGKRLLSFDGHCMPHSLRVCWRARQSEGLKMTDTYAMGVDIGSTASKCLILKNGGTISGSAVIPAGTGTSGPGKAVEAALGNAGIERGAVACTAATGYGRNAFEGADFTMSELSCHAAGAHALFPDAKTVVDIGGQDLKVIRIGAGGSLESFLMNDKCAAGTGRFLEVMARALELDISEFAEKSLKAAKAIKISSTCTVFAESEVISQLAGNADISELIAGIHESVAVRAAGLVRRLGLVLPLVLTGGVALNAGVVSALEKELNTSIIVSPLAQLSGAYGAAIYAYEYREKTRQKQ